jgi:hypothetical protein
MRTDRIVELVGDVGDVTQREHTIAVVAFDDSYLTEPDRFRYVWRIQELTLLRQSPAREVSTRSAVYRANFDHDGTYKLQVAAIDRYGMWSEPREIIFRVALPKPNPVREMVARVLNGLAFSGLLYFA